MLEFTAALAIFAVLMFLFFRFEDLIRGFFEGVLVLFGGIIYLAVAIAVLGGAAGLVLFGWRQLLR